jgi:hypothetical protein
MKRRTVLLGSMAAIATTGLRAAQMRLGWVTPMGTPMRAWVAHPAIVKQQCPEWCWAASASMIFASHGHPVEQTRIVRRIFGGLVCHGAGSSPSTAAATMDSVLSGKWVDDNGNGFNSTVIGVYDVANGVNALDNAEMINELSGNNPLLYANRTHAMVIVDVDYFATPIGPNVREVGVLDPWPYSPSYHYLSPAEMVPVQMGGQLTYVAAVHIQ